MFYYSSPFLKEDVRLGVGTSYRSAEELTTANQMIGKSLNMCEKCQNWFH